MFALCWNLVALYGLLSTYRKLNSWSRCIFSFIGIGVSVSFNAWSGFLLLVVGRAHWRAAYSAARCQDSLSGFRGDIQWWEWKAIRGVMLKCVQSMSGVTKLSDECIVKVNERRNRVEKVITEKVSHTSCGCWVGTCTPMKCIRREGEWYMYWKTDEIWYGELDENLWEFEMFRKGVKMVKQTGLAKSWVFKTQPTGFFLGFIGQYDFFRLFII